MVRERHAFEGQLLKVMGWTHQRGALHLTLVLPDGTRALVPASWTDLGANSPEDKTLVGSPHPAGTVGSLRDLLHARQVVDALLGRLGGAESAGGNAKEQESARGTTTDAVALGTAAECDPMALGRSRRTGTKPSARGPGPADREGGAGGTHEAEHGGHP